MKPETFWEIETWLFVIGAAIGTCGSISVHSYKLPWTYAQYIIAIPEIVVVIAMWLTVMWYLITAKESSDSLFRQPGDLK